MTLDVTSFLTGGWLNQTIGPLITTQWLEDAIAEAAFEVGVGYVLARTQVVSILEGIDPDDLLQPAGYGCGFVEGRTLEFDEDGAPTSRTFFIRSASRATVADGYCEGGAWTRHDMDVAIYYRKRHEWANLDEVVNTDYEVIRRALLDVSLWDRPTSSLISLATTVDELLPADDETHVDDDGDVKGVWQVFRVPLTQTEQTS